MVLSFEVFRESTIMSTYKVTNLPFFNVKDPGARLIRWRLELEQYHYNILYKSGVMNKDSDALSGIAVINSTTPSQEHVISDNVVFC